MKREWPMILATVLIVLGLVAFLAGIYNSARDAEQACHRLADRARTFQDTLAVVRSNDHCLDIERGSQP